MKKSLFLLAAMASATASFAQTTPATTTQLPTHRVMRMGHHQPKTPEQSADHHTARMTKKLGLSADQQAKVHQIFLTQAQEAQAMKASATSRQGMHQDMQANRAKYQAQLQGVLTPAQYSQLVAMKQEHKGHRGHDKSKS